MALWSWIQGCGESWNQPHGTTHRLRDPVSTRFSSPPSSNGVKQHISYTCVYKQKPCRSASPALLLLKHRVWWGEMRWQRCFLLFQNSIWRKGQQNQKNTDTEGINNSRFLVWWRNERYGDDMFDAYRHKGWEQLRHRGHLRLKSLKKLCNSCSTKHSSTENGNLAYDSLKGKNVHQEPEPQTQTWTALHMRSFDSPHCHSTH